MRGDASVTFVDDGKEITREMETVEFKETVPLQESVEFTTGDVSDDDDEVHSPTLDAVVPAATRQRHEAQPKVDAADAEQQQPDLHAPEEQSYGDAHASPGFTVRHAPVVGAHKEQPRSADEFEQQ